MLSRRIATTKDSNYYPLVITYRCNSIFANNTERGVRWATLYLGFNEYWILYEAPTVTAFRHARYTSVAQLLYPPVFRHVAGKILNT